MLKYKPNIIFTDRFTYTIDYQIEESLGSITLPYSLGAAINDAAYLVDKYNKELMEDEIPHTVVHSSTPKCRNYGLYNNNNIEGYKTNNILYNNINHNCDISTKCAMDNKDTLPTKDKIKIKALGMIDVHLGAHPTKVLPQTAAGWKWILMTYAKSTILNFHYVQDLISTPYKYVLEWCDIKRTLEKVMRTMGETNNDIIQEAINIAKKELGDIESLEEWITKHRFDYTKLCNEFYSLTKQNGFDRWLSKFLINSDDYVDYSDETIDHTSFDLRINEYGAKRNQKWKSVVDRTGNFCLYVTRRGRLAMASYRNKYGWKALRKALEIHYGFTRWFDFDKVSRPIQKLLDKYKDVQIDNDEELIDDYANVVIDFFGDKLPKYEQQQTISNQQETHIEDTVQMDVNPIQQPIRDSKETTKTVVSVISTIYEDLPKTEDGSTDWSKVDKDHKFDGLDGDDFWEAMSRL